MLGAGWRPSLMSCLTFLGADLSGSDASFNGSDRMRVGAALKVNDRPTQRKRRIEMRTEVVGCGL